MHGVTMQLSLFVIVYAFGCRNKRLNTSVNPAKTETLH